MTRRSPKPLSIRLRSLYRWHRWLGVLSAFFVIWLAVSGMLLEHSHQLRLDRHAVTQDWLQAHYGINPAAAPEGLLLDGRWLAHADGHLYLDTRLIGQGTPPVGIARLGLLWAVASRESLWLLNEDAEVLDQIQGLDLPGRITALGVNSGALLVATERGIFSADPLVADWPDWQASTATLIAQYQRAELPPGLAAELTVMARNRALTWERLLLDAHSGRILGNYGVWLMDAMAVIFIVLGITGLWLWLRFWRSSRQRRRHLPPG